MAACADLQQVSTSKSLDIAEWPTPRAAPGICFLLRNASSPEGFRTGQRRSFLGYPHSAGTVGRRLRPETSLSACSGTQRSALFPPNRAPTAIIIGPTRYSIGLAHSARAWLDAAGAPLHKLQRRLQSWSDRQMLLSAFCCDYCSVEQRPHARCTIKSRLPIKKLAQNLHLVDG